MGEGTFLTFHEFIKPGPVKVLGAFTGNLFAIFKQLRNFS